MIKNENGVTMYFDRNGVQIMEGSTIRYENGTILKVYPTSDGRLGTDATNPQWIKSGRAIECEYGIYPFTIEELNEVTVVG